MFTSYLFIFFRRSDCLYVNFFPNLQAALLQCTACSCFSCQSFTFLFSAMCLFGAAYPYLPVICTSKLTWTLLQTRYIVSVSVAVGEREREQEKCVYLPLTDIPGVYPPLTDIPGVYPPLTDIPGVYQPLTDLPEWYTSPWLIYQPIAYIQVV